MIIYSMGDIHFRALERHVEFKTRMQTVLDMIRGVREKNKNVMIVIAGDIYHSKLNLTPEAETILDWFFYEVSMTAVSVIIPGNHDANITNNSRLDVLTPFVDRVNSHPKQPYFPIHYFKSTGIYSITVNNVECRIVTESILDNQKLPQIPKDDNYTIGVLHGTFQGSVDEAGFNLGGQPLPLWVDDCDFVILGDIHKRQTLQYKKPKI